MPGGVAPWAAYAASGPLDLQAVGSRLRAGLVPVDAPLERPSTAAVLILLFEVASAAQVMLIRRGTTLLASPGEIAFPGGRIEPGETPLEAALRETEEEIALPRDEVDVVGRLAVLEGSRRRGTIVPFVGFVGAMPAVEAHPVEVDAIITVRISDLLADGAWWEEIWSAEEAQTSNLPFFAGEHFLGDDMIWGASARMLTDLLQLIARQ